MNKSTACSLFTIILILTLFTACNKEPQIDLSSYTIESGFELELVASEPNLIAPVAIDFDSKGRIWVAEMQSYMSDLQGLDMEAPTGRILILEDQNKDGEIDDYKVFLDGLVLPRALALVYGGLLYVEPPNLWFVEIEDDLPTNRILIDSLYATSGNPEHQPNGLVLNLDNWLYNAKSHFRYQRKNGNWIKEPTTFRGQWGISHDNFGRLYFNDNSTQLIGDFILPNLLIRNKYHKPSTGVNQVLTDDQRVYPPQPVLVNRGYVEGFLNEDSLLVNVTAACAPLVYRGGQFPSDYNQNVFVCIPEANVIKRNILTFEGDKITAKQAWQEKEFLTSMDEGFRPVNLAHGPDGNMYIVDMHRGVIGHYAYLSPYFKEKIRGNKMDTIINFGRILRVKKQGSDAKELVDVKHLSVSKLVDLLGSSNGWLRDHAQHELIYKNHHSVVPELEDMVASSDHSIAKIHALHTLSGLDALSFDFLLRRASVESNPEVIAHIIVLMEALGTNEPATAVANVFNKLLDREDKTIDLYLASSIGTWIGFSQNDFYPLLSTLISRYNENPIYHSAVISSLQGHEDALLLHLNRQDNTKNDNFITKLVEVIDHKSNNIVNSIYTVASLSEDRRTKGWKLYQNICGSCHGQDGMGIDNLAPPLLHSQYVTGSLERLSLIILHGIKGPIHVNDQLYEFNHVMPGLKGNKDLTDSDIEDVIAYLTSSFTGRPRRISSDEINQLRSKTSVSNAEYTEEELKIYE